ncbi:MAG: hypothetical protein IKY27_06720 [Bacteroidales bacterium]|nr:hypothetical protein [Bacteroidales bacterium]
MKKVLVCLLIGLAMLTTSCKKNDENSNQNNSKSETPIAVYNNETGIMTYNFDAEMLTIKINEQFATRSEQDRYIVESVQILDSLPSNARAQPEIKVVLLDTEDETSYSFWLMEFFTYKKISSSKTEYYLDDEVKSGIYEMASAHDGYIYKYHINGESYLAEKIVDPQFSTASEYIAMAPRWFIDCIAVNCEVGECHKQGSFWNADCGVCTPPNSTCTRQPASWIKPTITGIFSVLVVVITLL